MNRIEIKDFYKVNYIALQITLLVRSSSTKIHIIYISGHQYMEELILPQYESVSKELKEFSVACIANFKISLRIKLKVSK